MLSILKRSALPFLAASILFLWVPLYSIYLSLVDINFSVKGFFFFSLLATFFSGIAFLAISTLLGFLKLRWLASGALYLIIFWVSISGFILPLAGQAGMVSPVDLPTNNFNLVLVGIASAVLTLLTYTKLKSAAQAFVLILVTTSMGSAGLVLYQSGSSFSRFSSLSDSDNVLVLSLDGLAGGVAKQVLEEHPELKEAFKDFIFYDNAIALSPATNASLRSELYGNIDFRQLSTVSLELASKLSDKTHSIKREQLASSDVMSYGAYSFFNDTPADIIIPGTLIDSDYKETASTALNFYPHITARIATPVVAKLVDDELRTIQEQYLQSAKAQRILAHKGASWDAPSTLQTDELVALTQNLHVTKTPRTVRYMHFLHTHFPVDFDEKCTYKSDSAEWFSKNQNYQGLINETHCALQQTADYLQKLRTLGVYDKTLFIVKSDHGAPANYFDADPDGITINNHPLWGYNRYRPLMMIKPRATENAAIAYNSELTSLSDLARTLCLHAPGQAVCDDYPGLDLLSPSVPDTSPQLYLDIVKDKISSYEYNSQMTVAVPREKDFLSALRNTGKVTLKESEITRYAQRKRDLEQIRIALEKYHAVHGAYPISESFDGLHSIWGRPDPDWIRGLAPTFIAVLPRDPQRSEDPMPQYLYRSDGVGYKLLSHGATASTAIASRLDPQLVDSLRKVLAFGYWTEGAQGW